MPNNGRGDPLAMLEAVAKAGSWTYDLDRRVILSWSSGMHALFGTDPAAPPPTLEAFQALLTPPGWRALVAAVAQVRRGAPGFDVVIELSDATPHAGTYKMRAEEVRADGQWLLAGIMMLVAPSAEAETRDRVLLDRLRAADPRWQFAIEGSGVGVWDWDATSGDTYYSDQLRAILGYSAEEFSDAAAWHSRVHPDDLARYRADLDEHFAGRTDFYVNEHRLLCKDGTYKWVADRGKIVARDAHGEPLRLIGTLSDIHQRRVAELALRDSEARFRATFNSASQLIGLLTPEGRLLEANRTAAAFIGMEPEAMRGLDFANAPWWPDAATRLQMAGAVHRAALGMQIRFEAVMTEASGRVATIDFALTPVRNEAGEVAMLVPIGHDISELKRIQSELHDAKELAQVTLSSIDEGVVRTDRNGRITLVNRAAASLLGTSESQLVGADFASKVIFAHHRTERQFEDPVRTALATGTTVRLGTFTGLRTPDGVARLVSDSTAPIRDVHGAIIGTVVVLRDATEPFALTERLARQAHQDELTGLPNRRALERRLTERRHAGPPPDGRGDYLMFIDLDRFKLVNDSCGHGAGDQLLKEIADLLRTCMRTDDLVARLGGDEFAVVLDLVSEDGAAVVAQKLITAIERHRFQAAGRRFSISASIGIVRIDEAERDASRHLIAADAACYAAKDEGRGRYHFYRDDDDAIIDASTALSWSRRLQQGLEENRLHLYLQRISAADRTLLGFEALVRLEDEHGFVHTPGAFLHAAKRFGLMTKIDQWVCGTAMDLVASPAFRNGVASGTYLSLNLGAKAIADPMFRNWFLRELDERPQVGPALWIELTESDELNWTTNDLGFLDELRRRGVRLYLDDFGTGYNSFDLLKRVEIDGIKIDRSVVADIDIDPIDQALVTAALSIVEKCGVDLVAEGIEDAQTLAALVKLGVSKFQGFFFHAPEPAARALAGARIVGSRRTGLVEALPRSGKAAKA